MGRLTAVVDAALVVDALAGSRSENAQAARLLASSVAAPALLDIEVASAFRRLVRHHRLDATTAGAALVGLAAHPAIRRFPQLRLIPRIWQLREALTSHDACYIALAEALRLPLATTDARLARAAAPYCDIYPMDAQPGA